MLPDTPTRRRAASPSFQTVSAGGERLGASVVRSRRLAIRGRFLGAERRVDMTDRWIAEIAFEAILP
jgi:hypothetical protein